MTPITASPSLGILGVQVCGQEFHIALLLTVVGLLCTGLLFLSIFLLSGFGGLGVACWPLVPKFAGSNPAEAVGFLKGEKILSTPSFGGEVKPSVPCRRFAACKRSLNGVEVVISAKF